MFPQAESRPPHPPRRTPPIAPSVEQWHAMSEAERVRLIDEVHEALTETPLEMMSKGRPHQTAQELIIDHLSLYFTRIRRQVYLATDLPVLYPGEESFEPDILAVLGVEQPAKDERMAWVVADEGRGPDLVIEVHHSGDHDKDYVENVARYARLRIPEYFIYDRRNQGLTAYRLTSPTAARYRKLRPEFSRYHSEVLDLDLAIVKDRLHFFHGSAELIGKQQLIDQLEGMVSDLEAKKDAERQRAEAERQRADLTESRVKAESILALLLTRQIPVAEADAAQIRSCRDIAALDRWFHRAITASAVAEIFIDPDRP